jgi:hypothetical protein
MRMYGSEKTLTDTDSLGHGFFMTRTDTDLEVVIGKWWGDDYIWWRMVIGYT